MERLALTIPDPNGGNTPLNVSVTGVPSGISLGSIVSTSLEAAGVIGILVSLLFLVYGGWFWMQSKGNKETLDKARRIIIYAVLGLIVISFALVAVNLVGTALNVNTLIQNGP